MYVNDQQLNMEVTDRISGEVFTKGFWMFDTEQFIVQQAYMGKERIINDFRNKKYNIFLLERKLS